MAPLPKCEWPVIGSRFKKRWYAYHTVLLGDEWSKKLLLRFAGKKGYDLLVRAALVADVMMLLQPCIRIEDRSDGDASLLASTVSKIRDDMHDLLVRGGIWLKEADGTCVHAALRAAEEEPTEAEAAPEE